MDLCAITAESSQCKNPNQPTPCGEQRRRWKSKSLSLFSLVVVLVGCFFLFGLTSIHPLKTYAGFSGCIHTKNITDTCIHNILGKQTKHGPVYLLCSWIYSVFKSWHFDRFTFRPVEAEVTGLTQRMWEDSLVLAHAWHIQWTRGKTAMCNHTAREALWPC